MRIGATVVVAMLWAGAALAQAPSAPQSVLDEAAALRAKAMAGSGAYAIVSGLTTEVGPRLAGTEAEKRGAEWGAAKLKAMGFQNVRIEEFMIDGWVRGDERARIVAPAPQPLTLVALGGSVATPTGGIEAEVVLFPTYDALLAAPMGSLTGKIALVTQRTIKVQDGSGYGATGRNRRGGASEAAKRGAVAYLLRSLGTHSHRFAHTGSMRYDDGIAKIPAAALSPPDVEQIERLAALGKPVRLHISITPRLTGKATSRNLIADIPGSDKASEIVVIGGHLDSWDQGTGAIDDGAGVAITTAAAKLILDAGKKPRRTIRLIWFGAEEFGLLGADAYVKAHANEMSRHIVGAESDFGAGPIYQVSTRFAPSALWAADALAKALLPLGIDRGNNEARGGPDMQPFLAKGMPVVTLQQDGRDYFDTHHTPDDVLDRIDAKNLDQNAAAYAVFTWLMANLDVDLRGGKASILDR